MSNFSSAHKYTRSIHLSYTQPLASQLRISFATSNTIKASDDTMSLYDFADVSGTPLSWKANCKVNPKNFK